MDSICVHEYRVNFIPLPRYDPEMIKDTRSRMSLFVAGLGGASSKKGRVAMVIGDMHISRFMVYVQ